MDGACWRAARLVDRLIHRGKHRLGPDPAGRVQAVRAWGGKVELPADIVAENLDLVDGLVGSGGAQFRRTVGGEEQQRHFVYRRFDDSRKPVGDGGTARGDPGCRPSGGTRIAQGEKGGAALVEVHPVAGLGVRRHSGCEWCASRAGGHDEKADAAPHQLLNDQVGPEAIAICGVACQAAGRR